MEPPKLLIGLGNPGPEYENTYHNAGLMFLDFLSGGREKAAKLFRYRKIAAFGDGELVLVRPLTFMNESGSAAKAALEHFKARPEDMILAHDDSDIVLGECRISLGSGSAGHHGVESVMKAFRSHTLIRIRIGIRKKPAEDQPRKKAGEFVLKKVGASDRRILYSVFGALKTKVIENETFPPEAGIIEVSGN